jgi:hypothetical protein
VALILLSYQINGFISDDFCKKNNTNCNCKNFDCGKYFCSLEKISCESLLKWKINSKNNYYKYSRIYKENPINMFKKFIENIKQCK